MPRLRLGTARWRLCRPWAGIDARRYPASFPGTHMIRVGFICDYLALGGQERALLNMVRGFDSSRFGRFVYGFRGGSLVAEIQALGVPLQIGSARSPLVWKQGWTEADAREKLSYRRQLTEALRRDRIDAVIIYTWRDGVDAALQAGVPVLIERLDGPELLDRISDKSAFDRIVCQSQATRDELLVRADELMLDRSRVELVYSGVDLDCFDPARYDRDAERVRLGIDPTDRVIGFVGRLAPEKNIELLLQSFALLDERAEGANVRLLIMGPDEGALDALARLQRRLGLEQRVHFMGGREAVAPVLSVLDLFATPTVHREGIPNAILEAMAMGLPIVSADVGSVHEVVDGNGFLVSDLAPERFAQPLRELLASERLRQRMGSRSRALSRGFDLAATVARYQGMITDVLTRKRAVLGGCV